MSARHLSKNLSKNLSQTRSRRLLAFGEAMFIATLAGCLVVFAIEILAEPISVLREEPRMLLLASR